MSIDKRGYEGLYIVDTTAFQRPVQIVRQFISNHEIRIAPYHRYKGLSSLPQKARESKEITNIPDITNPIYLIQGLDDMRL